MYNKIALLLSVLAVAFIQVQGEKLIWSDEFKFLDLIKWTHLVTGWDGGNGEFQYYRNSRTNSYTKDGKLFIRPTPVIDEIRDLERGKIFYPECRVQPCTITGGRDIISPYFSARLTSDINFSFKYGRVEIRAKMPTGDWLWPAIWLLPTYNKHGPYPQSGEIDIVEARGNRELSGPDGVNHGINEMGSAIHFGTRSQVVSLHKSKSAGPGKNFGDGFHKYEFIWNPDQMKFLVDGQVIQDIKIPASGLADLARLNSTIYKGKPKNAPFDERFHFVLNVAVGGNYFPKSWKSNGVARPWQGGDNRRQFWNARRSWLYTWGTPDQHAMQIDYIRVYQ